MAKTTPKKTNLQKFEIRCVSRSELKAAPYNPRQIDEHAKKKLRGSLKRLGLVQPIVVNTRTMHIIGGHQRLEIMDQLESGADYQLDVAAVDVDPKTEKEMNILLNNELVMGTFDLDKLDALLKADEISIENCGFEDWELRTMLPSFEPPIPPGLAAATEQVEQLVGDADAQKKQKAEEGKALKAQIKQAIAQRADVEFADSEFFVILVFPNRDASDKLLRHLKISVEEKYVPGQVVLDLLVKNDSSSASKAN